jgi:nitrous oxidase accessory protein NosD
MERHRLGKWVLVIACASGLGAPAARATDLCGTTVIDHVTLSQDLVCSGDGLIVGASGIRIDLNGFSIQGSGTGAGVAVSGYDDVTIAGGTIRQFAVGIRVASSTELVIRQIEFIANAEGIDFQAGSIHNTVKDSAFRLSGTRALMLRTNSKENDIKANTFADNRIGILVFGGVDNSIKNNLIAGGLLAGIRVNVIATGNVVKDNIITSNAAGVEFLATPAGSAVGNELKGNTIAANACGLKGPTAGNEVHDNSFESNTTDACP